MMVIRMKRTYICIDLKSFYASVECQERGLDPIDTNLVVADATRSEKTICLAVSPALKKYGIPGRARLFEINQKIREINNNRKNKLGLKNLNGKSYLEKELIKHQDYAVDFIAAVPRMSLYIDYSSRIYNIYLKHLAPEDIYVYSIDEVFCDVTNYLKTLKITATEFVTLMIKEVYEETGITATAGIGSNLYLCKVAMDIVAKHVDANEFGVRIGELDEESYKKLLWNHRPLTDFWRVGRGYATKLEKYGIYTMGDIARCSIENEDLLYKLFGVNAEYLIDHAWGIEPCTMKDIKEYKPSVNSLGTGQVLHCAYGYEKTKLIVKEMTDLLCLDLINKEKAIDKIVLSLGYDIQNIDNGYNGEVVVDFYGRCVPKPAHGTINIGFYTASEAIILEKMVELFERIVNKKLLVKRINISFLNAIDANKKECVKSIKQLDLFSNEKEERKEIISDEEKKLQKTLLSIKDKYGKNAILKGMNLEEGATTIDRNQQIGGHRA